MSLSTKAIFTDPEKAREHFEAIRWPSGKPTCPHCGVEDEATLVQGKSHRPGLYQCNACRTPFTVTVGTVMEKSHIPLNKWLLGFHLMASSKKGISAHQLHRLLGITYKSAWFMCHRIREAMTDTSTEPMGGKGKHVEADETYIGRKRGAKPVQGGSHKMIVLSLVERGGKVRSFHIDRPTSEKIAPIVAKHVDPASTLNTDEADHYIGIGRKFAAHGSVAHSRGEYVKGTASTNTAEGFYSVFKRGMKGVYQHCGEQHLHRYLSEFDFRYSNRIAVGVDDVARTKRAIEGAEGKRLTYHQVSG